MDGRKALAKAFGAYVDDHRLTQTDVAAAGGPSTTSQTKIRTTDAPIASQTLQKIDKVTGWPPGTSARIIAGAAEPTEQRTITSYSAEELAYEVRRRLLLLEEGGTDARSADADEKRDDGAAAVVRSPEVTRKVSRLPLPVPGQQPE